MQVETKYIAKDGKAFTSESAALDWEAELDKKADEQYTKYLTSHSGKRLLQDHSSTEEGYWQVIGESDDPGIGGGRGPDLGIYKGRLVDVIRKATSMNAFWAWGGGGSITKVNVTEL